MEHREIEILIADDHPVVRQGLCQAVEKDPELRVVAEVGGGKEALSQLRRLRPQVAVLDIDMPDLDGFAVAQAVRSDVPDTRIIFLTIHREESFLNKALRLGAQGYVLKDSATTDIIAAIKTVARGETYLSPMMASHLINRRRLSDQPQGVASLTPSERTVLKLIAEYKTTREIAAALVISTRTVETHRANICLKLGLRGSHALMKFALANLAEISVDSNGHSGA